jgi:hypothetical protein
MFWAKNISWPRRQGYLFLFFYNCPVGDAVIENHNRPRSLAVAVINNNRQL